jgi:hypothetical protein
MMLRTIRRDMQELLGRTIAVRLSVGLLQHSLSLHAHREKKVRGDVCTLPNNNCSIPILGHHESTVAALALQL